MGFLLLLKSNRPGNGGRDGTAAFAKANGNSAGRFSAGAENHLITILQPAAGFTIG
jgi:hypothetical protein